jgi:outer membrane protein assembly factor BamB
VARVTPATRAIRSLRTRTLVAIAVAAVSIVSSIAVTSTRTPATESNGSGLILDDGAGQFATHNLSYGADTLVYDPINNEMFASTSTPIIHVFNATTGALIANISLGTTSHLPGLEDDQFGLDPAADVLLVQEPHDTLGVVSIAADAQVSIHRYHRDHCDVGSPTYDANNGEVYANCGNGDLIALNATTLQVTHCCIKFGTKAEDQYGPAIVAGSNTIYMPCLARTWVVPIDTDGNLSLKRVHVEIYPNGAAYDPLTQRVYVAGFPFSGEKSGKLVAIDPQTNRVVGRYSLGAPLRVVALGTTGLLAVSTDYGDTVTFVNASSGKVVATDPVKGQILPLAYDDEADTLWVANSGEIQILSVP